MMMPATREAMGGSRRLSLLAAVCALGLASFGASAQSMPGAGSAVAPGAAERVEFDAGVSLALDFADLAGVAFDGVPIGGRVQLSGMALRASAHPDLAREVTLGLTRFSVLAPGARVVIAGAGGEEPIDTSGVVLLAGEIAGEPGSLAYIGISDAGIYGFLRTEEGTYSISTGAYDPDVAWDVTVTHASDMAPFEPGPSCGFHPADPRLSPGGVQAPATGGEGSSLRSQPCRVVEMAIDSDWEYTSRLFGGNAYISANYGLVLLGGVSQIFQSELNVRLTTNYVRTWSGNVDPYNQGQDLLDEFAQHWGASMGAVHRDLAHLLSGRTNLPYGGVAYLNAICEGWGYGLSSVSGSFPQPIQNRHGGNWDLFVVSHEVGHNFGTGHTHDSYTPVIDGCGNGDCSQALGGTIMSYCHGCAGGMTNIDLVFGPRVQERIWGFLATRACVLPTEGEMVALNDVASLKLNATQVEIPVLDNDVTASCLMPQIQSVSTPTAGGSASVIAPFPGPIAHATRRFIRYIAPPGFVGTDTFTYTLTNGSTATVTVVKDVARAPENPARTAPGLEADYYVMPPSFSLPNFAALTPYASEVVALLDFEVDSTGQVPGTGLLNLVAARYEGFLEVPTTDYYTLTLTSDDGSRLYLGDELLIDNDGRHTMRARSATRPLGAGKHAVRVEYFEYSGPAGLNVKLSSSTMAETVVPASAWSRETGCLADLNGDGLADVLDFLEFVNIFSSCADQPAPCPDYGPGDGPSADFNGDGFVDVLDLLDFLDAFSAGC